MDGGAWWAAVHGVAKSQTQLSDFPFTFYFPALEKEMATHSSVLAWRIPGMREPGGLPSMGSHRVGHDWSDLEAAAADVFLELSCFFDDPTDVGSLISGSCAFSNPVWTSGSSRFMYCWSLAWRIILSITLLAREMNAIVSIFEHSLALPFFGIGMKTDLFQFCGHYWVFQICWHIECSTFTLIFTLNFLIEFQHTKDVKIWGLWYIAKQDVNW